jgi:diacylglycerol kinase family enzyme
LVVNPLKRRTAGDLWSRTLNDVGRATEIAAVHEMRGEEDDALRLEELIRNTRAQIVVAVGGDGTVAEVVRAIVAGKEGRAPALAIVPLGTANNSARSLGLLSYRQRGAAAVDRAVQAICAGGRRRVDLGVVNGRLFVGAVAIGVDAEILSLRNRLRSRLHLRDPLAGYPLYLASCAVSLLRGRRVAGRLEMEGTSSSRRFLNLLVSNEPLYGGEFRFDAEPHDDDGLLDVVELANVCEYVRTYVSAWRRHLRYRKGAAVLPPAGLARVESLRLEFARPVRSQIDGEEGETARRFELSIMPRRLEVCVPISESNTKV